LFLIRVEKDRRAWEVAVRRTQEARSSCERSTEDRDWTEKLQRRDEKTGWFTRHFILSRTVRVSI